MNLQRRGLMIRLAGGGAVMAALPLAAGCDAGIPTAATAAWRGPAGDGGDIRRWVLAWALLAPHSHNLQGWLADLREPGVITLRCDLQRLLPQTDPLGRQIVMSQGCFIELLDLAARQRGHRAEITPFPEGPFPDERIDARPVARIRLLPDAAIAPDPLFAQIPRRHTHRGDYAIDRPVADAAWQAMRQASVEAGGAIRFGHVQGDAAALAAQRAIAAEAWRIELSTPHTLLESYRWLRIGSDEIARHRDGLSLTAPFVVWMDRLGLFDRSRASAPDSAEIRGQIRDFDARLASTPAFLWLATADNARATQLAAGRAYVRVQLAATAAGVVMQPLSQALQEYPEVAGPYAAIHRLLAPQGGTVQMWARVGHPLAPVGPAPRRPLDAIIQA